MTCSCAVGPRKPGGLCEQAGRRALTDEGRTTFAVADGAPTAGALTWTGAHADVDVRAHSLLVGSAAAHSSPFSDARPPVTDPVAPSLAPERRKPLSGWESGLVRMVELRGLEPLTPTLIGRHDPVRRGSPQFHKPVDVPVRVTADRAHDRERRQVQLQLQPAPPRPGTPAPAAPSRVRRRVVCHASGGRPPKFPGPPRAGLSPGRSRRRSQRVLLLVLLAGPLLDLRPPPLTRTPHAARPSPRRINASGGSR